jgi:hypothetical protein
VTTPEREEARADLVAYIKSIPCARPEEAIRIAAKWGLAGRSAREVTEALEMAATRGVNPRDFIEQPMEGEEQ